MKIAILGCGGVGGYYGGKLAKFYSADSNVEVIFFARGKHLAAIQSHGLKVSSPENEFIAHPALATDSPSDSGKVDVLLVCVKTYDLESSMSLIKAIVNEQTIIIPLANGIEAFEILKHEFANSRVFQGCCYLNSFVESPGNIKFRGGFEQMQIGFSDEESVKEISAFLSAAGIDVFSAADISDKVWEKFIFGSVLSGIGSLENESFGEIAASPTRIQLARKMMNESLSIAHAKGVLLPETIVDTLLSKISTYPKEARTSMQLDFVNGKRTELETFIGYVIRRADELKLEVPEYRKVYALLRKNN